LRERLLIRRTLARDEKSICTGCAFLLTEFAHCASKKYLDDRARYLRDRFRYSAGVSPVARLKARVKLDCEEN